MTNNFLCLKKDISLFSLTMGGVIFCYLLPWHSPLGKDFLVNTLPFIIICLGIAEFVWWHRVVQVSLSAVTWLLLAMLLSVQPLFLTIAYPDALIFPITCLLVVALVATVTNNISDKKALLNRVFLAGFIMASLTFAIQVMQMFRYQIEWGGWVIARGTPNGMRFDANFGQANHAAYGFVLALCGVVYQLHQSFTAKTGQKIAGVPNVAIGQYRQYYRFLLMVLFVIFTVGLALTQSRAGMVMMVAVIGVYFISQPLAWGKKLALSVFGVAMFLLYYVGTSWLAGVVSGANSLGAVSRMAGGQGNRPALNERALMMFSDHPITGVGWNNYMLASIDYAQHFKWPEIADHSHNFATMILAEMGIIGALCFLPIVWVLVRAIHFRHSAESAIALAFVVASILYASVEYPLWYFRYLAVFAMFLALVEQKYRAFDVPKLATKALAGVMAILIGAAIFYAQTYLKLNYLDYGSFTTHKNHLNTDSQIDYRTRTFGFGAYDGRLVAMKVPVNNQNIDKKLEVFNDVLTSDSSQFNLMAKAQLLAYKGDKTGALEQIQAACIMIPNVKDCANVNTDLQRLADTNPAVFGELYTDFVQWRKDNPVKTGLATH